MSGLADAPFPHLRAALAAAAAPVPFWWRDDDATDDTGALGHLLALTRSSGAPVTLAVIPARATEALAAAVAAAGDAGHPGITIAQHGWDHGNRAHTDRQRELADDAEPAALDRLLADGMARLRSAFGASVRPVMVPPWNRADPGVLDRLPGLGYRGVSGLTGDTAPGPLPRVDVDIDVMDWSVRTSRGLAAIDAQAAEGVVRRRDGRAGGPVGLMTHHLDHDATVWDHVSALAALIATHPAAAWVSIDAALAPAEEDRDTRWATR